MNTEVYLTWLATQWCIQVDKATYISSCECERPFNQGARTRTRSAYRQQSRISKGKVRLATSEGRCPERS
jgi:hypothetical protein